MESSKKFDVLFRALKLYNQNEIDKCEEECTKILQKNPLDQAAWTLKLSCLTESLYIDELDNNDVGIAETFLEQNVIAPNARPGTSFNRPLTSARGANPLLRPTTNAGRPLSGVVRPMTTARPGTMDQAVRTSRTAKTARAVTSSSARFVRLGTASMASNPDGPFVNLARLNIEKYAKDAQVNRQLFEYVFYHEGDVKTAHQIAAIATKEAEFNDWYWKNQLGKLGMFQDAEKQFLSSLKTMKMVETYAYLAKIYNRLDQPLVAIKYYEEGLESFKNDITILTGLARVNEQLGKIDESIELYKEILAVQANNVEAIACIATNYFYSDLPEIALRYYRRIMQMGVNNAELFLNVGLCCFFCQQFDLAIACIERAHATATEDIQADVWYNTGHVALSIGDVKMADRCFQLALTADQDHGESLCNLGILRLREGKIDQAKSFFHNAKGKAPHLFEPYFNLAILANQAGQYSEALINVNKSLEIFPEHVHSQTLKRHITILYTML
ncbi:unnamed protein product, partial [Mesorhabditis belari]|uniref:Tetratricopeptide repeat protein 8 n=1 Tax=Mesorhabditis belari TaxID=2138241 RepID=A0AAF3FSM4_9BILA